MSACYPLEKGHIFNHLKDNIRSHASVGIKMKQFIAVYYSQLASVARKHYTVQNRVWVWVSSIQIKLEVSERNKQMATIQREIDTYQTKIVIETRYSLKDRKRVYYQNTAGPTMHSEGAHRSEKGVALSETTHVATFFTTAAQLRAVARLRRSCA
jgi:hypothetical protein